MKKITLILATSTLLLYSRNKETPRFCHVQYETNISEMESTDNDNVAQAFKDIHITKDNQQYYTYRIQGQLDNAPTIEVESINPDQTHFEYRNDESKEIIQLSIPESITQCEAPRLISAIVDFEPNDENALKGTFEGKLYREYKIIDNKRCETHNTIIIKNGTFNVSSIFESTVTEN